jgi:hypothetical protein
MLSVNDEFPEVVNVSHLVQNSEHKTCLISIFKNVDDLEHDEYKILFSCLETVLLNLVIQFSLNFLVSPESFGGPE